MKLTKHQKRILAALLELERRYSHCWWSRDSIGQVVGAGGYHSVIQKRTILSLSELGLVLLPSAGRRRSGPSGRQHSYIAPNTAHPWAKIRPLTVLRDSLAGGF